MQCINPKCNQEMRTVGALVSVDFPRNMDDGLLVYMCVNDDCERLGLLTPLAMEKKN